MSDHGKFGESRPGYIELKMPHPELRPSLQVTLHVRVWSDGTMLIPFGPDVWIPISEELRESVWNHLRERLTK